MKSIIELRLEAAINEAGEIMDVRLSKEDAGQILEILKEREPNSLTAKIVAYTYCCRCSACDHMLFLPGIIPSKEMLKDWKFCPYCGLKFESEGVKNAE